MNFADLPNERYYDNTVQVWLFALGILVLGFGALVFGRRLALRRFGMFALRTETRLDDLVVSLIRRTRYFFSSR